MRKIWGLMSYEMLRIDYKMQSSLGKDRALTAEMMVLKSKVNEKQGKWKNHPRICDLKGIQGYRQ